MTVGDPGRRVVVVTGLSGAGKASILRMLEDCGYEAVDNPPLALADALVDRAERLAFAADGRTRDFDPAALLAFLAGQRQRADGRVELVYATADDRTLLRRFTETRRRHPLATTGPVRDAITAERRLTAPLRAAADWLVDTTDLALPALRRLVEQRFAAGCTRMTLSLISFAYPAGLPAEADLVFDARFLRNPHYDPILGPLTGLEPPVAEFVAGDPFFGSFMARMTDLLTLVLPRFQDEGKKYASVAVGCTGGRHRSVHVVEELSRRLRGSRDETAGWHVTVTHRDMLRGDDSGRRAGIHRPEGRAGDGARPKDDGAAPHVRTNDISVPVGAERET